MYIKVKNENIVLLLLVVIFLDRINFFYLGIPKISSLSLLLIFVSVVYAIISYKKIADISDFIKYYSIVVAVSIFCCVMYTQIHYDQNITASLHAARPYLLLLLVIPIGYVLDQVEEWDYFLKIINTFSVIWLIIVIVQYIVHGISGKVFIQGYFQSNITMRNGHIRIALWPYCHFMMIYNAYLAIFKNSRKAIVFLILGLGGLIFVEQTRAAEAVVLSIIMLCWLLSRDTDSKRIVAVLILSVAVVLAFSLGVDEMIMESFSTEGEKAGSTIARLYAIGYYWDCFKQNPLFGFSLINDSTIENGPLGLAWISDVGIIGQLAKLGLFIIPIYFPIIFYLIRMILCKELSREIRIIIFLSLAYILFTSGSLMILDGDRAIMAPIIIGSLDSLYRNNKALQAKDL